MTTRILLVDDHAVVRKGLAMVLRLEPDFEIIGEAGSSAEALALAQALRPDIILLDRMMPGMACAELVRAVRAALPETRILILTGTEVDDRVFDLVAAGIEGYVLKQIEPAELVRAIRAVVHGEAYLHPDVMKKVVSRLQPHKATIVPLTPRELEVLQWMATPNTYKQIAFQLGVSEETIRSHAKNILEKMSQSSRSQAVLKALRLGLIELDGRPQT